MLSIPDFVWTSPHTCVERKAVGGSHVHGAFHQVSERTKLIRGGGDQARLGAVFDADACFENKRAAGVERL